MQQQTNNHKLNFNNERLKLVDAITQFENQIINLQEDLLHYSNRTDASEKYIFLKQQQIKVLSSVIETLTEYSENTNQIYSANQKEIAKLKNEVFKLQGVCIFHGISNFNYYLRMKTNALILTVKNAFNEGYRQTPFELIHPSSNQEKIKMQISHLTMMAKQLNGNGK
jgi:hypothetical protein